MLLLLGPQDRVWLRVAAVAIRTTARRDGLAVPKWVDDLESAATGGPSGTDQAPPDGSGESAHVPLVYRPDEAAEVLRVSPRTVSRLIAAGELRAFSVFKDRRIAREDLVEFVERRRNAEGQTAQSRGEVTE